MSPEEAQVETGREPATEHIGVRLRELRQGRRMTLKEVAQRANVSESFLSQVERGLADPSLKRLQAFARALGLEPGQIFDTSGRELPHLVPHGGRAVLQFGALTKYQVTPTSVYSMEVIGGHFEAHTTAGEPYVHGDSDEVLVVTAGEITAEVDGKTYEMKTGDSLCYRSAMPHTFATTDSDAEVLWIISPPSY